MASRAARATAWRLPCTSTGMAGSTVMRISRSRAARIFASDVRRPISPMKAAASVGRPPSVYRIASGHTGAPISTAGASRFEWNGSSVAPSVVVPSGNTATDSPAFR